MKAASVKKHNLAGFFRRYRAALRRHLGASRPVHLKAANRLGREAVDLGLDTLELVSVHDQALLALSISRESPQVRKNIILRAGAFFAEAILPIESTHRTAVEANNHLSQLNEGLSRHNQELIRSKQKLKIEIAKRKVAERSLKTSRRHTGQLLAQSEKMQEQLRLLSRRVLSAQEEERKRISRELHDVIAQMLAGINVRLATLKVEAASNTTNLRQSLTQTQRLVEKSVGRVHEFARELRPSVLDDLGLIPALRSHMERFGKETGIQIKLTAHNGLDNLNNAERTALYRVAQEALTNVSRHAKASQVEVVITKRAQAVHMAIKDNGQSFDVGKALNPRKIIRLGLLGMKERVEMLGGRFEVISIPDQGTTIRVELPGKQKKRRQASR